MAPAMPHARVWQRAPSSSFPGSGELAVALSAVQTMRAR
jgi:hypothetical protein